MMVNSWQTYMYMFRSMLENHNFIMNPKIKKRSTYTCLNALYNVDSINRRGDECNERLEGKMAANSRRRETRRKIRGQLSAGRLVDDKVTAERDADEPNVAAKTSPETCTSLS